MDDDPSSSFSPTPSTPFEDSSSALPKIFFWTEYFETGFSGIDLQHRGLVNLINEIPGALATGLPGAPYPDDLLLRLRDYAAYHFRTEEAIWERIPHTPPFDRSIDHHEKEHRNFAEKIARMDHELGATPTPRRGERFSRRLWST
ncbi:MAG: bacteriohemerythrin [Leptospirales bacterium]